jgi:LysR family transcriptional regulator, nitrogen assimilation regulatory protein
MELRELRALVSIAEAGSLSGAAQKLNLTQPALSALLRRLEDELEVQIVRRHSRGVAFTAEGKFLLEKAHTILNDVAETTASLRELAEEPVGTVRIGLPASVAGGLVPELVPKILERYPRIQVHVVEAMSGSIVELLHLGRLDLAVLFDIQPMPGLRSEPFLIEEVMLLVSPDDPLGGLGSVSLEEVLRFMIASVICGLLESGWRQQPDPTGEPSMATPRSRSFATALLTARSLTAALPPSYTTTGDVTPATGRAYFD